MRITRQQIDSLIAHARAEWPRECCGLIGVRGNCVAAISPMRNVAASPVRYRLDPPELLRVLLGFEARKLVFGGIYHSHPQGSGRPSPTDIELARQPGVIHLIISLAEADAPAVRAFRIVDGQVGEVRLEVIDESR